MESPDIIRHIAFLLDIKSLMQYRSINKYVYEVLDNTFFENIAINNFGYEFWIKAKLRPPNKSRPLNCIKKELIRIEIFQELLENYQQRRWLNNDFYNFWNND